MRTVGIIGFGALGRQILGLLEAFERPDRVLFFDDERHREGLENSHPFDRHAEDRFADTEFYVGLGYRHLARRREIVDRLLATGRRAPALVHPGGFVASSCRIGAGCVVFPGCNLDAQVVLENGSVLNNSVVVSHDAQVGPGCFIAPGAVICGWATIGASTFLGAGVLVANNRRIGERARVGIGSVVTRDIPAGASAIGNPLRILEGPLELE